MDNWHSPWVGGSCLSASGHSDWCLPRALPRPGAYGVLQLPPPGHAFPVTPFAQPLSSVGTCWVMAPATAVCPLAGLAMGGSEQMRVPPVSLPAPRSGSGPPPLASVVLHPRLLLPLPAPGSPAASGPVWGGLCGYKGLRIMSTDVLARARQSLHSSVTREDNTLFWI